MAQYGSLMLQISVLGEDVDNDARLIDQYHKLFSAAVPASQPKEKVVKLFDDKE